MLTELGFSQREADVFNATTITCHGENGVSLWTTYRDGSKKETKIANDDIADFKFAPEGKLSRKRVANKPGADSRNFRAIKIAEEIEKSGNGTIETVMDEYSNKVREKIYRDSSGRYEVRLRYASYDDDGHLTISELHEKKGDEWQNTEYNYYYPNGNLESTNNMTNNTCKTYNEDGTLSEFGRYEQNGIWQMSREPAYRKFEEKKYYPDNKTVKSSWVEKGKNKKAKTYYECGHLKSITVSEWKPYGEDESEGEWVEKSHSEFKDRRHGLWTLRNH